MLRALNKKLSAKKIFDIQQSQYTDTILLEDTVPAGESKLGRAAVSNLGHFLNKFITGSFDTLYEITDTADPPVTHVIDNAVNFLSGQLFDQAGNRRLFSDFIPFDLFLTPGRAKNIDAENNINDVPAPGIGADDKINQTDPVYPLFNPVEFQYLFGANSEIQMEVKNDSNHAISYAIVFHGIRLISGKTDR